MKKTTLMAILMAATSTAAFAASDTQEFVTKASSSNMFEIESSKLALDRSNNAEVKQLASQIIADHEKAGNGLTTAISQSNAMSKTDTKLQPRTSLLENHAEMLNKLKTADADDFDAAYLDAQESAHEEAISLFEDYSENGEVAAIKQFAKNTLPTLEKHEDHVERLDDKETGDNL